jgi:hypothetical protein
MLKVKKVKALSKYKNHPMSVDKSPYRSLIDDGFILFKNHLSPSLSVECHSYLVDSFFSTKKLRREFDLSLIAEYGCVRSPFIESNLFRDLMLDSLVHDICKTFFPCDYILHLARGIVDGLEGSGYDPSSTELHRDIPYLFTPSKYPVSLSFLYFFSNSSNSQLAVIPKSHQEKFYDEPLASHLVPVSSESGSLLVFNSSLLHCSLPSEEEVSYCLYMFTTPLIKQVVDYSSIAVRAVINQNAYKVSEVNELLGARFLSPSDDLELLQRKIDRVSKDPKFYKTEY